MASRSDKLEEMARVFHSLGNPTRLSIMTLLTNGEMSAGAICKKFRLSETTVSHHLSLLRQGGMVVNRRDGRHIFYSLADLSKHRSGKKAELAKARSNAAKFGPVELVLPKA